MILSMTGYGEARDEVDGVSYRAEVRSLNNRYFKSSTKLPEAFLRYETEIDKLLRSRLGRGSVTLTLRVKNEGPSTAYEINAPLLAAYLDGFRQAAGDDKFARIDLAKLAELPGVLQPPEIPEAKLKTRFELLRRLTNEAIDRLIEMRKVEGVAILADLRKSCDEIRRRIAEVRTRCPVVLEEYHVRLRSRVVQLLGGLGGSTVELDPDALSREVAIFAERCDVNEEVSRTESHLDQFAALCEAPDQAGRKLDFIAQELLREANTIGSKSNDAEIAQHVVAIKAAVDRIKEQVQNVE